MLSTINVTKSKYNLPENNILPPELMEKIFYSMDSCSSIYNRCGYYSIIKYDFNTLEKKLEIKYKDFLWRRFSVSLCDTFIAASHYSPCFVSIYNQEDGLFKNIILPSDYNVVYTTFLPNNDLLITQKHFIYHYHLGVNKSWEKIYTYEIPESAGNIEYITNNSSDMFVCYGGLGEIFVFNFNTRQLIHAFTDIKTIYNIRPYDIMESIDFKKNKLVIYITHDSAIYIYIDLDTKILHNLEANRMIRGRHIQKMLLMPCLEKAILFSDLDKCLFVWDLDTKRIIKKINLEINTLGIFTPGGSTLITEYRNKIKLIDLKKI